MRISGEMNRIELKDQVAVVTGGAGGIGLAVSQRLILSGAKVALWDIDPSELHKSCGVLANGTIGVNSDVSNLVSVSAALEQTENQLGPVSILVNSAGVAGPNAPLETYPIDQWHRVMAINLTGTYFANRVMIPGMKARNYGRIVNIASIAGKEGNVNAGPYSASKAGVIGLTKSLGKELAAFNIAVNCVTPAAAKTKIFDQLEPDFIAMMLSKIPRGRFLDLDECAAMIAWLCSAENSFTTGAVFDLSGGRATY